MPVRPTPGPQPIPKKKPIGSSVPIPDSWMVGPKPLPSPPKDGPVNRTPPMIYEAPIEDRPPGAGPAPDHQNTPSEFDRHLPGGGGGGSEGSQVLSNALSIIGQQSVDEYLKYGAKKRPKRSRADSL